MNLVSCALGDPEEGGGARRGEWRAGVAGGGAGPCWQRRAVVARAARVWRERGVRAAQGTGSGGGLEWRARAQRRRSGAAAACGPAAAERRRVSG